MKQYTLIERAKIKEKADKLSSKDVWNIIKYYLQEMNFDVYLIKDLRLIYEKKKKTEIALGKLVVGGIV